MRRCALAVIALLAITLPTSAQRRPTTTEPPIVITGATVRPGNGPPIENATVIVRGDRLEAVGAGLAAPAGATVIDATGAVITPGLVATMTALGLEEIELERASRDTGPEGDDADAIRAAFSAADGYNPLSTLIPVARLGGITSVTSVPEGGLVPGTSAWADLLGASPTVGTDAVLTPVLALHVSLNDEGIDAAGGARSSAITRLRELLDDARLYARQRTAFDRGDFRDTDVSRLDLERVGEALAGRIPVVIKVSRAVDIVRTIALGREYGLRIVLAGVEEGWMVAPQIAAANVPVIVQAMTNLPERFSRLHARYDNAALLARAGVRVMLMSPGAWDARNLRQEAGNAVAWGMDPDAALAAITSLPAEVFGMRDHGVIAAGRRANLVVWSGDPFETTSAPTHVIVAGRDLPLRSRQTLLLERYRSLDSVPRGWTGTVARDRSE
ncbi:amidohydrolase family protein [Sandaracinus amylolyticus]|uniref:amidohydrolase family protein n=1 Tax=Sandaracinus amylolyticus TaxID=927083 RepID=UPI001F251F3C|nr:amidohydrolase family protein [Sandaracinus amylolyticus]